LLVCTWLAPASALAQAGAWRGDAGTTRPTPQEAAPAPTAVRPRTTTRSDPPLPVYVDRPVDPAQLFAAPDGPLSPGYPARRPASTGPRLDVFEVEERSPILGVLFNPALFGYGKWSGRVELAPLRAVSVFVEYSRLTGLAIPKFSERVDGHVVEVGLHLFPMADGLRGFYLGPRYISGTGEDQGGLASGELSGWGADLGYQWVAGFFMVNVGVGIGKAKATVTPRPETADQLPEGDREPAERSFLVPLATVGIGLAL
jgi:hypothetical protein